MDPGIGIRAHVDLSTVKEDPHHSSPLNNRHRLNVKKPCGAQHSNSLWHVPEKVTQEHQCSTQHRDAVFGSEDAESHFIQEDGKLGSVSNLKKRLMDRERQRRHRERIRADPEKQQAHRERERQRYQRRKSMVSAVPEQMPSESQSHGLSDSEYQTEPTTEDHDHPKHYAFPDISQNLDTETGRMAHMDSMVMKWPTPEADVVDFRRQIKEMNPASRLSHVTEKETQEHVFSTQHRGAVFGSQDVGCYFVQQNGELCSLSRLKKRLMDRERQRRYRERIRSNPMKQSDDEKERRRFMDRERQRRRRERMRSEPDKQQAYAERERQRLLDRERQRRCRQRLQADPVRWQAYLEKERHRSREAARRRRAKKSLAKALTGWISEWGQDSL
ncbi:zinc finger CCCH domain-containing protein 13-like isoform X2 [Clupea harengus]|uniref:Zinc finger CCCH domain-containing protein 13-like isoform X2 n=1 Tax=Clupea harengus TaxID=7950 RepID=A0A6P3VIX8_CLUHA|nr:zinc finger CCCH domain-containing protein 13-like isoform X2 [Clupea harengus]